MELISVVNRITGYYMLIWKYRIIKMTEILAIKMTKFDRYPC
jgi:hypothetical protein